MIRMIAAFCLIGTFLAAGVVADVRSSEPCRVAANGSRSAKRGLLRFRAARSNHVSDHTEWLVNPTIDAVEPSAEPIALDVDGGIPAASDHETDVWPQASALFPANDLTAPTQ
jgi:hypothetical protein